MPTFAPLTDWDSTRQALHHAAQVLAVLQKAFLPVLQNSLHLSLLVRPTGLTTRPLSFGALFLDFTSGEVVCMVGDAETRFALNGQSQRSLRAALIDHLAAAGFRPAEVKPADDDSSFAFDPAAGAAYIATVWTIYGVIARVRGDWLGAVTPMVIWPHGFDLSTLYFPNSIPDEHAQPHLNVGFSPTSTGFPRPYLYAYIWPLPEDITATPLPPLARWTTDGWTGVVIDYDRLRSEPSPEMALEETLRDVCVKLRGLLG